MHPKSIFQQSGGHGRLSWGMNLIDLCSNQTLKMQLESMILADFWCAARDRFDGLHLFIPLAIPYFQESGFISHLSIMSKARNHLNPQVDLRITNSWTFTRFNKFMNENQEARFHYILCSYSRFILLFTIF